MKLNIDQQHIWHPYSSTINPSPVYGVTSANGVYLNLQDGRQVIDGMSSWWCMLHGYNHPKLNQAIIDQTHKMAHVMFGGLTHEPAINLTEKLITLTPAPLQHVFYADSGSVAVEVALKMAIQFWQAQGLNNKKRILSHSRGYHGDTFGAMSVCDPVTGMHHLFADALMPQHFAEAPQCGFDEPWDDHYCDSIRQQLSEHHHELAAIIIEPIVQAAGGMRFYSPHYLKALRQLCDEFNVLLIVDEIATNFGRTGELFGVNHADISPDIMCLGKALTGGYMTLAATMCTAHIAQTICNGEAKALMHGPTFMANPLACAVANASIELLIDSPWQQWIQAIAAQLTRELAECLEWPHVASVRVLGAIGVIELKEPVDLATIQPLFVEQGVWIRPFGKLVYIMPPFIISPTELSNLTLGMKQVIKALA
jgi:adenosylmethionine-8-amino-7-oxononanoate aminotransferase